MKQKHTFYRRKSTKKIAKVSPSNNNYSFRKKTIQQHDNNNNNNHFGSSRGHSWPSLSQWLPRHLPWVWFEATCAAMHVWPVVGPDGHVPYRLRGACWFGHDDDLEEDRPCSDVAATYCSVVVATGLDGLAGRIRRLERIVEQMGPCQCPRFGNLLVKLSSSHHRSACRTVFQSRSWGVLVPQLVVAVVVVTPQERVQNRTPEQIALFLGPQIVEECVQNRTLEQISGSLRLRP